MYLLFARANHPNGYGYSDGRAHGYVVLAVKLDDPGQEEAVVRKMYEFYGINERSSYGSGYLWEWYGGSFELIARCEEIAPSATWAGRFWSIGDNRFFGVYTAKEVLESNAPKNWEAAAQKQVENLSKDAASVVYDPALC